MGRIDRFVMFAPFMRRSGCFEHIAPRVSAGINQTRGMQGLEGGPIQWDMIALRDHGLFPIKPEPVQVLDGGGDIVEFETIGIDVVIAQEKFASGFPRAFRRDPKGASMTEMEIACRGRGKPTDVTG